MSSVTVVRCCRRRPAFATRRCPDPDPDPGLGRGAADPAPSACRCSRWPAEDLRKYWQRQPGGTGPSRRLLGCRRPLIGRRPARAARSRLRRRVDGAALVRLISCWAGHDVILLYRVAATHGPAPSGCSSALTDEDYAENPGVQAEAPVVTSLIPAPRARWNRRCRRRAWGGRRFRRRSFPARRRGHGPIVQAEFLGERE